MTELLPSAALVEAARADRERLHVLWRELQGQRSELLAELERIDADINELVAHLRRLGEIIGDQLELPVDGEGLAGETADNALSGGEIRKAAVAVLVASPSADEVLHYKDWFELLETQHTVKGRDPQAVFLTQISRSPLIVRGPETGTYRLDRGAPHRLEARLEELRAERDRLVHGERMPDSWDLDSLTAKLQEVTLEASRTERQLAEARNTIRELGVEDWFVENDEERRKGIPVFNLSPGPATTAAA